MSDLMAKLEEYFPRSYGGFMKKWGQPDFRCTLQVTLSDDLHFGGCVPVAVAPGVFELKLLSLETDANFSPCALNRARMFYPPLPGNKDLLIEVSRCPCSGHRHKGEIQCGWNVHVHTTEQHYTTPYFESFCDCFFREHHGFGLPQNENDRLRWRQGLMPHLWFIKALYEYAPHCFKNIFVSVPGKGVHIMFTHQ